MFYYQLFFAFFTLFAAIISFCNNDRLTATAFLLFSISIIDQL